MFKISQTGRHLISLLVLLLAIMSSLVFGSSVMKWDAVDLYLPWKFFISECLINGELPLWNPYINGGFAQMGDPGTWYPISWLLGFSTGGYSLWTLHFEYLLHLYIAGVGFYFLAKKLCISPFSALLVGAAYMLSGVMIGNAQHIGWIVSAAWIPWTFLSLKTLIESKELKYAMRLALFLFLLLSGGYPGFFIVVVYLIALYTIYKIYNQRSDWDANYWKNIGAGISIAVFVFILLSGIVLYSSFEMSSFITRGVGLNERSDVWNTLVGSIYPNSVQTTFFPLASSYGDWDYWSADISMINSYFSALLFIILLIGLFMNRSNRKILALIAVGFFFLTLSFGESLPFRSWLSQLPMMDLFRFPALFRLFFILSTLISCGFSLDYILKNISKKHLSYLLIVFIAGLGILNLYWLADLEKWKLLKIITEGWSSFIELSGRLEFRFLQNSILIALLSFLFVITWKFHKYIKTAIAFAVLFELFLFTRMQLHSTVYKKDKSLIEANTGVTNAPTGFPPPNLNIALGDNTDISQAKNFKFLWRNLSIFRKTVTQDGYSPYAYKQTNNAIKSGEFDKFSKQPILFLCSELTNSSDINHATIDSNDSSKMHIQEFSPNFIRLQTKLDKQGYLVLNQNYYPHWSAQVNGKDVSIIHVSDSYMAIPIPKGKSNVLFSFKSNTVLILFIINVLTLILILPFSFLNFHRKENQKRT